MEKKKTKELLRVEPSKSLSPFETAERWFEDVFRRPFSLMGPSWWPGLRMPEIEEVAPSVDIFEDRDDVVVKAELPGMKKEDIDVSLTDDAITISGEKKKEEKVEKKNYYSFERSYGSFTRSFRLPTEVQTDKAKARFKDGVLEIRIPKTEEAKKKEKKILIE
ncbi:MAG: Hsp20/alpha crystallin family protein [Nitrospirae bacterium CG_4_10_14_0_8_um_filter_41_23]|nr:Hsp20/alpha crystallin family protein [Nitrospirota bacterium]OIP61176.1 MAG: moleuclar chaperone Hap20 [Nitrospirae bacterium CG2_30_41_42]PIQ94413.1 MAG: moleuclar chaperone Hap20 [Nitrospirae bacterium CG11_big_fil_rev_8_21_14_0_20_41_14]PIV41804.1 MAG: Hsp20/alpha crystallin family protein [Nitrospirae bacterium CG02_land_8_20_14_3_00_41_53]PIW86327.1 MAG: Hsp20/alpha crystallin family protein [Nitrospirae bacterium CG_4_8_14_3_um_filter_41_47]PIY86937.1 MAG: Hsp20/alpha crystallin fami